MTENPAADDRTFEVALSVIEERDGRVIRLRELLEYLREGIGSPDAAAVDGLCAELWHHPHIYRVNARGIGFSLGLDAAGDPGVGFAWNHRNGW